MTSRTRLLALFALAAAGEGSAGNLHAQVAGLPVRNAGLGTGIAIALDAGFPSADAGKGFAVGATGALGVGPLGVTASVSRFEPKDLDARWSVGGSANLKLFGGPLIPLSLTLQAGVARTSIAANTIEGDALDTRIWHFPVGVGVALTIPNPVFSIKPWLAPRVDVRRTSQSDGGTATIVHHTDTDFGLSGGVDLGFLSGLTVRLMYDRVQAGEGVHPSVLSLGVGIRVGT